MATKYRTTVNGDASESSPSASETTGCRLSIVTGFVLVFLAVAISVGVGLIVFFAVGKNQDCRCSENPRAEVPSNEALEQQCINKVQKGSGKAVCDVCQPVTTTSSLPHVTSITTTTPAPNEEPHDYRLPITVRPYLYSVVLQPNFYGGEFGVFDFEGSVKISVTAEKSANSIVLHARDTLNITKQTLTVKDLNSSTLLDFREQTYDKRREFHTIHLEQSLVVGHHYQINTEFRGPLASAKIGRGLFLSHYEEDKKKIYLVATHLETSGARWIFPCFDEPALKAQFDITLVRRSGGDRNYTSLTNTGRVREEPRPNGMVADVYERTVMMPTYLLAFIVCDYKYYEDNAGNVEYRTWAMPKQLQFASKAQEYGVKLFNKFEEYFDPPYPLNKLDNIVVPEFRPGAMENWGLIIYRMRLLYEPGVSTGSDESWMAEVISHEITHQWFGNIVSPKWWNWLWLNEAFASFWDYHIVGELYPEWRKLERNVVSGTHSVFKSDGQRNSKPMTPDADSVQSYDKIRSMFSSITYTKGAQVIRMMHLAMGQTLFIKGLNRYLTTHAFGNAEHQDLWDALSEEARFNSVDLNMTEIMDPWVTQMNYPVVNVEVGQNKVTFTQRRFLYDDDHSSVHDTALYGYKWTIPVTYTTSNSPNFTTDHVYSSVTHFKYHQHQLELDIDIPENGWIIVNLQQCGYFRVNYDVTNWNNIVNFLQNGDHNVIHPINRAQIINDAWNLAMTGRLELSIALRAFNFLHKDRDYVPWRAFVRELDQIDEMLEQTQLYGDFKKFMDNAVKIPYSTHGGTVREDMNQMEKIEISQIVTQACRFDHQPCVDTAVNAFSQWMSNSTRNSIAPDVRSSVYCTGVRHGGQREWTFVYDQYHQAESDTEKSRLRNALACTKEPWLLQRLLEMSTDAAEVTSEDMNSVIISVANNKWGRDRAWNFVIYNIDYLAKLRSSSTDMKNLVLGVTRKFNTDQELQKIKRLVDSGMDTSMAGEGFSEAMKATQKNIDWMKKYYHVFSSWLSSFE